MSRARHRLSRTLAALGCAWALAAPRGEANTCAGLQLGQLPTAGVGSGPVAVVAADFNRDSLMDAAVVNSGSDDVSILQGDGGGKFTVVGTIQLAAANPSDIAVGDLDRDGFQDLVVAYASSPQVQVLRGFGFSFVAQGLQTLNPAVANPSRIFLGHLTGDADLDLVMLSETGQRIRTYAGVASVAFAAVAGIDIDTSGASEAPSGGVIVDFDHDGRLDLAVTMRSQDLVRVYQGDGTGKLTPLTSGGTGKGPVDVCAGDVDRDGWTDLVTADSADATASVLLNAAGAAVASQTPVSVGGTPIRVALADLDNNGILDLSVLEDTGPRLTSFVGQKSGPAWFDDATPYPVNLAFAQPRGLAMADFKLDGRVDFVTTFFVARAAAAIENTSGTPCERSSFGAAPRSYFAGDRPVASAAGDFDNDGRTDLVVATGTDKLVRILDNDGGDLKPGASVSVTAPRAVATADVDNDGAVDVVVASGAFATSGEVLVYRGNGAGSIALSGSQPAGLNTSALAIADFNGDGRPDVAATSEDTGQVFRFLGDGAGGLSAGLAFAVGASPSSVAAADFNADQKIDLAVANFGSNSVSILTGDGSGNFSLAATLAVGAGPQSVAAADLDGDTRVDIVTADRLAGQVSVVLRSGAGGFLPAVAYAVGTLPAAVALVDLQGADGRAEIAVTTSGMAGLAQSVRVLANNGSGAFTAPGIDHAVRNAPQAITPFDADGDGLVDLAVPCSQSDAVVVLIQRPPGPPLFSAAPRTKVQGLPRDAVAADLDRDGRLDLVVANSGGNSISLLKGDGGGGLSEYDTPPVASAEAVAAGDFNRDGQVDLAVSSPTGASPGVAIFFGSPSGAVVPQPPVVTGGAPDDLVAGDFDLDGDLDLALCDKSPAGQVRILRNDGLGGFTALAGVAVGDKPTAIVAADFDADGDLDLAVANDESNNVVILRNTLGAFDPSQSLTLDSGDTSPVALGTADFDGNGTIDLVAASFDFDRLHFFRNAGGSFNPTATPVNAPALLRSIAIADVNRDGRPDVVAVASGVSVLRGLGGLSFAPAETVVAWHFPSAAVVEDWNRDGRPDVAVVNEGSDDVSLFASTGCETRRLETSLVSNACDVSVPFLIESTVSAYDDGGNAATCATGVVTRSIVPGTGDPTAVLGGPATLTLVNGVASFTGGNQLTIDKPGRYKLQFQTTGTPPVHSRFITLTEAGTLQILGPPSTCPGGTGVYSANQSFTTHAWTLTPTGPPPFSHAPTVALSGPPLAGSYTLDLQGRNECLVSASRSIYFGDLASVSLQTTGLSSVCVDCISGTAKAVELGGGAIVSRRWGYRTVSGSGPIVDFPGETGETYVLKGASFPGPGSYFVVVRSQPTCGVELTSTEWAVTVTASVPTGEVRFLAATSRGTAALGGMNRLQWMNTTGAADEVRVRWNKAPDGTNNCAFPADTVVPATGEASFGAPVPMRGDFPQTGLVFDTAYCYSVFVRVGGSWSQGRTVKGRPFNAEIGQVRWAYATGGTAVAPPTVSGPAIMVMSNDRTAHGLVRGAGGGEWPAAWTPTELQGVAHSRGPVIPFPSPLNGSSTILFAADDMGFLHAIDATSGARPWPEQGPGLRITGAAGGTFAQFGGVRDVLFVGTRDGNVNNALRALKPANGAPTLAQIDAYAPAGAPGPIGPINGTPAIDNATRRVYFASHSRLGGDTLWCLDVLPSPPDTPVFAYKWSRNLGNITGSPVLRGGRVYVGTDAGSIYSVDAETGLPAGDRVFTGAVPDGPAKGFLFPDRRNDDLIFSTNTTVWSISDDGAAMSLNWSWTLGGLNPSIVLLWPNTSFVYVGSGSGRLYQLDFSGAPLVTSKLVVLGGGGQVGAPSLDIGTTPRLLLVGSEPGVVYGVEVPIP